MKKLTKIIAAIVFSLSATFAHAVQSDDEFCEEQANMAEIVMKARQAGVPMSKLLEIGAPEPNPYRLLIISAYELPRMSYEPNQQKMIEDFRNDYHLLCFRAMERNKKKRKPISGM